MDAAQGSLPEVLYPLERLLPPAAENVLHLSLRELRLESRNLRASTVGCLLEKQDADQGVTKVHLCHRQESMQPLIRKPDLAESHSERRGTFGPQPPGMAEAPVELSIGQVLNIAGARDHWRLIQPAQIVFEFGAQGLRLSPFIDHPGGEVEEVSLLADRNRCDHGLASRAQATPDDLDQDRLPLLEARLAVGFNLQGYMGAPRLHDVPGDLPGLIAAPSENLYSQLLADSE